MLATSNLRMLLTGALLAAALGVGAGMAAAPPRHPSAPAVLGPRIEMHDALRSTADVKVETNVPRQG
jgi:hypothetical protein